MRLLMDDEGLGWDEAWDVTSKLVIVENVVWSDYLSSIFFITPPITIVVYYCMPRF